MKTFPNILVINPVILTALVAASCGICHAQVQSGVADESAPLIVVSTMPTHGAFFSMQFTNFPPAPYNPWPALPLFTPDPSGQVYYYDDRGVDYEALRRAGLLQAGDPTPPGDFSGSGTNGPGPDTQHPYIQ